MFEKYIVINESKIILGQTSGGIWYCKELPANNTKEADALINEINTILNKYNSKEEKIKPSMDKKVKGIA